MNNKLTIEHIAPYLPYRVKIKAIQNDDGIDVFGELYQIETGVTKKQIFPICPTIIVDDYELYLDEDDIKLILHPLSDLKKEIEHNGKKVLPSDELSDNELSYITEGINDVARILRYDTVCTLLSWHFDIFGLIDRDLAIDINIL